MVWSTTQSTLNKVVNEYNRTIDETHCKHSKTDPSKTLCDCNSKTEHLKDNPRKHENIHQSKNRNCKASCQNANLSNPMPHIDRDFLLLTGLIYILWKEGADQKLILALVMVLLG